MNGQLDLSTIHMFFIESVGITYGGSSYSQNSSNIGGEFRLNNNLKIDGESNIIGEYRICSYSNYMYGIKLKYSNKKLSSRTKLFYKEGKNNFEYRNIAKYGFPIENLSNAEMIQKGIMQENSFMINKNSRLNFILWYMDNNRNIPPTMTVDKSIANQKDNNIRILGSYNMIINSRSYLSYNISFLNDYIHYVDKGSSTDSKNSSYRVSNNLEYRYEYNRIKLYNNVGFSSDIAKTDYYNGMKKRDILTFSSSINYSFKNLTILLSLKDEINKRTLFYLSPSFGVDFKFLRYFVLKANIAKNYRRPSLNDLYWRPGGNENLNDERAWCYETGIMCNVKFSDNVGILVSSTLYSQNIENYISWQPTEYSYWEVRNTGRIWSRGTENRVELSIKKKAYKIKSVFMYNYTLSTNEYDGELLHNQMIYVPRHNMSSYVNLEIKKYFINYSFVHVGLRFTSYDNKHFINPYSIHNLIIGKSFEYRKYCLLIDFHINNLFNREYQVIEWRPSPLRNYEAGIVFKFNNH